MELNLGDRNMPRDDRQRTVLRSLRKRQALRAKPRRTIEREVPLPEDRTLHAIRLIRIDPRMYEDVVGMFHAPGQSREELRMVCRQLCLEPFELSELDTVAGKRLLRS